MHAVTKPCFEARAIASRFGTPEWVRGYLTRYKRRRTLGRKKDQGTKVHAKTWKGTMTRGGSGVYRAVSTDSGVS